MTHAWCIARLVVVASVATTLTAAIGVAATTGLAATLTLVLSPVLIAVAVAIAWVATRDMGIAEFAGFVLSGFFFAPALHQFGHILPGLFVGGLPEVEAGWFFLHIGHIKEPYWLSLAGSIAPFAMSTFSILFVPLLLYYVNEARNPKVGILWGATLGLWIVNIIYVLASPLGFLESRGDVWELAMLLGRDEESVALAIVGAHIFTAFLTALLFLLFVGKGKWGR